MRGDPYPRRVRHAIIDSATVIATNTVRLRVAGHDHIYTLHMRTDLPGQPFADSLTILKGPVIPQDLHRIPIYSLECAAIQALREQQ